MVKKGDQTELIKDKVQSELHLITLEGRNLDKQPTRIYIFYYKGLSWSEFSSNAQLKDNRWWAKISVEKFWII